MQWSAMESFVMADQFVAEAEARHGSALLSQNMVQKEHENKIPLTATNAIIRSAKFALVELHHFRAQLALCWTNGTVLMV